jgi:hypothetical protein
MGKWIEQTVLKRSANGQYVHEETLAIKEMQIKTIWRFLSHPSQNGNHQENKQQMLGRNKRNTDGRDAN